MKKFLIGFTMGGNEKKPEERELLEGTRQGVSLSISIPEQASTGDRILASITATNNDPFIHDNAKIYFHPVGPVTEMWWIKQWSPHVPVEDVPGGGVLFKIGDLKQGQSFALKLRVLVPKISGEKEYKIEVGFESLQKPMQNLYEGKIRVLA